LIRVKSSFPVNTHLLFLSSDWATYRPRVQKKNAKALVFQSTVCTFGHRQFQTPMIKLPFKTADVQGQSRQPNFQNLSIRKFDGLARLLEVCINSYLHNGAFW